MTYSIPQSLVYEEAARLPSRAEPRRFACFLGGNAWLFRYAVAAERLRIGLGAYDSTSAETYAYPSRPDDTKIDLDYVKLFVENALLRYHHDPTGGGHSTVTAVIGYSNRVRSNAVAYIKNTFRGVTYDRHASLLDRDVRVGDFAILRAGNVTLRTTVKGFHGEPVAAVTEAAVPAAGNQPDTSVDCYIEQTAGDENCISAECDASLYNGIVEGNIDETYLITVTQGSTAGDLTTALLRVRSASGNDDANNVVPGAFGDWFAVGARGAQMRFLLPTDPSSSSECLTEASSEFLPPNDLLEGQSWTLQVSQNFVEPTATSSGTYTGSVDTTYIVEVTRGGYFTDPQPPQITVTTNTGSDASGPTNVTALGVPINVGTRNVRITFSGAGVTGLRKGDRYLIAVLAAGQGSMQTLEFSHALPSTLRAASDLELQLFIRQHGVEVPVRHPTPGTYNYEVDAEEVTVNDNIEMYDDSWTDGGVLQPLPLREADLFLEYRAWLQTPLDRILTVENADDLGAIPGAVDPDNPLKYALSLSWKDQGAKPLKYVVVGDPDDMQYWKLALSRLVGHNEIYGIVPLTFNDDAITLCRTHVLEQSAPELSRRCTLWTGLYVPEIYAVADAGNSKDKEPLLATIGEDPETAGSFTILEVDGGNGQFITLGVRAGDTVRFHFQPDGWDGITYSEYVVAEVINEDSLKLQTGPMIAEPVPRTTEVWRVRLPDDMVEAITTKIASIAHERVRAIWPDRVETEDNEVAGYFAAAVLAAIRSNSAPHQGLTNVEIPQFTAVPRADHLFSFAQLNLLSEAGAWVLITADDGAVVTRHAVTSLGYNDDLKLQEEMIVSNKDDINDGLQEVRQAVLGKTNAVDGMLTQLRLQLEAKISQFMQPLSIELGGQLLDGSRVDDVRKHVLLSDRVVVSTYLILPAPLNYIDDHQQLIV